MAQRVKRLPHYIRTHTCCGLVARLRSQHLGDRDGIPIANWLAGLAESPDSGLHGKILPEI